MNNYWLDREIRDPETGELLRWSKSAQLRVLESRRLSKEREALLDQELKAKEPEQKLYRLWAANKLGLPVESVTHVALVRCPTEYRNPGQWKNDVCVWIVRNGKHETEYFAIGPKE